MSSSAFFSISAWCFSKTDIDFAFYFLSASEHKQHRPWASCCSNIETMMLDLEFWTCSLRFLKSHKFSIKESWNINMSLCFFDILTVQEILNNFRLHFSRSPFSSFWGETVIYLRVVFAGLLDWLVCCLRLSCWAASNAGIICVNHGDTSQYLWNLQITSLKKNIF